MEIVLSGVTKVFNQSSNTHTVLRNVSFTVGSGEFVCLIGPSGCGKTTLLRCIAGLEQPNEGRVTFTPVNENRRLGMVFQEHALFPWLSLVDNIALVLRNGSASKKAARAIASAILSRVGLTDYTDFLPHQVSGGMRQRASVARAWVINPQILLMDEPFVFVDYQTRLGLYALLSELLEQTPRTVLFVTHDIPEAVLLADRVIVLSEAPGQVRYNGIVDLPRPRDPARIHQDSRYAAYISQLLTYVQAQGEIL
jgi:NitT/TauT family transport system ATP-binding protein